MKETVKIATPKKKVPFSRVIKHSVGMMFRSNPRAAIFVSLTEILRAIVPSLTALLTGLAITRITEFNWPGFVWCAVGWLGLMLINTVTYHISDYFSQMLQYDIQNLATEQLYAKVAKIPIAVRETKENADKLEIAEGYALSLPWLFPQLLSVASQTVALVTAFVVLANISLLIAAVVFIAMIPNMTLTVYRIRKERDRWKGNSVNRRRGWGFREQLTDQKQVMELRLNDLHGLFIKTWRRLISRDRVDTLAVDRKLLPWETASGTLQGLVSFGVLLLSGKLVIDRVLDVGYIVTIKNLVDNLNNSGYALTSSLGQIGNELLNAGDYFGFIDLEEEKDGDTLLPDSGRPPRLEFRDVTFTYPGNDAPTIKDVSFVVEPAEDLALVGENGSGKTTLVKLLLGVYQPDSGQILVDGIPLEQLNKKSYYRRVGALFQDFARYYFATFSENIWFGDHSKKHADADLEPAVNRARLGGLLKSFPHGYRQILSKRFDEENGTDLSGGQWQRLALARGFFRNSDVLILDEPTAAVDAKAEYEIFQEIARNQVGKTTIIISHRFSTVRKAQKILVISDGAVVESGTHAELMQHQKGLYREMFELQAEGYQN
jgi:ATP-binding cassette subfamily B protein/ATP-binding cassette subfamily C protein